MIQAMLLLHSEILPGEGIPLNGPHGLALGEAADVLHSDASENEIRISVAVGEDRGGLRLEVPNERSTSLIVLQHDLPEDLDSMTGQERGFVYLSAERLGPRDLQEVSVNSDDDLSVGPRGEFTAHVLSRLDRRPVPRACLHPDTSSSGGVITLKAQTELWMSTLVSPIQIEATWLVDTNAAMIRFRPPNLLTQWLRPSNVGFGLSYALPIVVAGLTSPPGGVLIVENPEAHLHPVGQSSMGRFLARVASAGTQVLVETHSDHVLDGVRRAVAADRVLSAEAVAVHYFGRAPEPVALAIDERGAMSGWPAGFFDQTERDLAELARAQLPR